MDPLDVLRLVLTLAVCGYHAVTEATWLLSTAETTALSHSGGGRVVALITTAVDGFLVLTGMLTTAPLLKRLSASGLAAAGGPPSFREFWAGLRRRWHRVWVPLLAVLCLYALAMRDGKAPMAAVRNGQVHAATAMVTRLLAGNKGTSSSGTAAASGSAHDAASLSEFATGGTGGIAGGDAGAGTLRDAGLALLPFNLLGIPQMSPFGGLLSHTWSLGVQLSWYIWWPALPLLLGWLRTRCCSRKVCAAGSSGPTSGAGSSSGSGPAANWSAWVWSPSSCAWAAAVILAASQLARYVAFITTSAFRSDLPVGAGMNFWWYASALTRTGPLAMGAMLAALAAAVQQQKQQQQQQHKEQHERQQAASGASDVATLDAAGRQHSAAPASTSATSSGAARIAAWLSAAAPVCLPLLAAVVMSTTAGLDVEALLRPDIEGPKIEAEVLAEGSVAAALRSHFSLPILDLSAGARAALYTLARPGGVLCCAFYAWLVWLLSQQGSSAGGRSRGQSQGQQQEQQQQQQHGQDQHAGPALGRALRWAGQQLVLLSYPLYLVNSSIYEALYGWPDRLHPCPWDLPQGVARATSALPAAAAASTSPVAIVIGVRAVLGAVLRGAHSCLLRLVQLLRGPADLYAPAALDAESAATHAYPASWRGMASSHGVCFAPDAAVVPGAAAPPPTPVVGPPPGAAWLQLAHYGAIGFGLSVLAAAALYYLIETPVMALLQRGDARAKGHHAAHAARQAKHAAAAAAANGPEAAGQAASAGLFTRALNVALDVLSKLLTLVLDLHIVACAAAGLLATVMLNKVVLQLPLAVEEQMLAAAAASA